MIYLAFPVHIVVGDSQIITKVKIFFIEWQQINTEGMPNSLAPNKIMDLASDYPKLLEPSSEKLVRKFLISQPHWKSH
jgi:hypothetical protein